MTRSNGCFVVCPGSHLAAPDSSSPPPAAAGTGAGASAAQQQQQQQEEALALEVPAGTAILTCDSLLHCSGPNRSAHTRRAWMPQFSAAPLARADGRPASLAIPLQPPGMPVVAVQGC